MLRAFRLAALLAFAAPAVAHAALTVPIDQTRRVTFGGTAASIVVGNPDIADVNVIDGRNLMVIGKRFGVTNLVVLDANGRTLFDSEVVVAAGAGSMVSITRGVRNFDYACTPNCQQVTGGTPTVLTPPPAQPQAFAPAPAPAAPAAPTP